MLSPGSRQEDDQLYQSTVVRHGKLLFAQIVAMARRIADICLDHCIEKDSALGVLNENGSFEAADAN